MVKRDGFGIFTFTNGSRYVGNWKQNKFHGEGTLEWSNGEVYQGTWVNDDITGYGIYSLARW